MSSSWCKFSQCKSSSCQDAWELAHEREKNRGETERLMWPWLRRCRKRSFFKGERLLQPKHVRETGLAGGLGGGLPEGLVEGLDLAM